LDFFKKPKYVTVRTERLDNQKKDIPDGLWTKCQRCGEIIYNKELEANFKVCPKCGYHFKTTARERIQMLLDEGSFTELFGNLVSQDPLDFAGYEEKLASAEKKAGLNEAVIAGTGTINGYALAVAVMDFNFMGGSMGSVVGEKITRTIEYAIEKRLPVLIVSTSGGARMQEGLLSLMQMAKTSAAVAKLGKAGLLYISLLADPTSGGVTASFASLGDIIISEPDALICFAGPRVIEQTIRQTLPPGAQKAEFLLKHGMIDLIVERKELNRVIGKILELHEGRTVQSGNA